MRAARRADVKPIVSPFGSAGRTVLGEPRGGPPFLPSSASQPGSRPGTSCSQTEDNDEDWRQMRASIKSHAGAPSASCSSVGRPAFEPNSGGDAIAAASSSSSSVGRKGVLTCSESLPAVPPPLCLERAKTEPVKATGALREVAVPARVLQRATLECQEREAAYMAKMKSSAQNSREVGCYDSIITFLEMNNLSGAYALGLAAGGFENLSHLLLADEAEVIRAIEGSSMDSVDEILFKEAVQSARGMQLRSPRVLQPYR